jgi:hypothetical protein
MIRWLRPGSFRKKSLSLEYVSLSLSVLSVLCSLFYSARALAPVIPDSSFFTVGRILATVVDSI